MKVQWRLVNIETKGLSLPSENLLMLMSCLKKNGKDNSKELEPENL